MTDKEDNALTIFCRMVAEMNDAQAFVDSMLSDGTQEDKALGNLLDGWLETLRCGESQEYLNELVLELIAQEDPQNA